MKKYKVIEYVEVEISRFDDDDYDYEKQIINTKIFENKQDADKYITEKECKSTKCAECFWTCNKKKMALKPCFIASEKTYCKNGKEFYDPDYPLFYEIVEINN